MVAPTAGLYVTRLTALIHKEPLLLLAHAYVRYLGDLSGGQMLLGVEFADSMGLIAKLGLPFTPLASPRMSTR